MLHFPRWKILLITGSCLLFVFLAIPSFLSESTRDKLPDWLPHHAVNLGLDLQGGSQLLLEIDFDAFMREQLGNLVDEIREHFREQKIGYRGLAAADVKKPLEDISPDLDIAHDGPNYSIAFSDKWQKASRRQIIDQSLEIVG